MDSVPLFHQALQLTPMLEVALLHLDAYCVNHDLYIAGYYEASKYLSKSPTELSIFTCKVADKIKENFGESVLVSLDNSKVPSSSSLVFFERASDGKWKKRTSDVTFETGSDDTIQDFLDSNIQRDLVDFDNHLDDISSHWLNSHINQLIVMK